jgi:hypothetical protein
MAHENYIVVPGYCSWVWYYCIGSAIPARPAQNNGACNTCTKTIIHKTVSGGIPGNKIMKKFNLEVAKAGGAAKTNRGYDVKFLCPLLSGSKEFYVFKCIIGEKAETLVVVDQKGIAFDANNFWEPLGGEWDIYTLPVKKQVWLNIYAFHPNDVPDGTCGYYLEPNCYSTAEDAISNKAGFTPDLGHEYVRSVCVREWEEV